MSEIAIRDVAMRFATRHGEVRALERISVTVPDGQFACVVGQSGCVFNERVVGSVRDPVEEEVRRGAVGLTCATPFEAEVMSAVSDDILVAYPPVGSARADRLARLARVAGTVVLEAIVTAEGKVAEIKVISGHPLLVDAAIECVKQWEYEPTLLNGVPTPVILTARVHFQAAPLS